MSTMRFNPLLATDSYKLSHSSVYPENITGMHSYIEARVKNKVIVPFGLQMWIQKFLTAPIMRHHIDEAEWFAKTHGEPFNREAWEYMIKEYNGFFPVTIRAVPEGTPVASGNVLVTIECTDPKLFWLPSYLETAILRAVWYPTTIASLDREVRLDIQHYYKKTGADMSMVPFALHDFGGRGVTSAEQAEIGGAAHLVHFMGSDTIEGVRAANYYYNEEMSAFSVPATEHSVECAFGESPEEELKYLIHVLKTFAKPGAIVSIVIDGYDVYRAAETLCTTLRNEIIESGAKVVFRPDSGDMFKVVPHILELQKVHFGYTRTSKGFVKINNVGIIQGDGVDRESISNLLEVLMKMGYAADNVIFGSGGALLQQVNRDTYKFAQKASAILVNGEWKGISKNPITDPGKQSKKGRLTLVRSRMTGEYWTVDRDQPIDSEWEDVMNVVYENGSQYNETSLSEIRSRAGV